jgi:prepilin-type N-terminal cleavage/methylation domain-containing protein
MIAHGRSDAHIDRTREHQDGFTLIEVMLAIVIGGMAVATSALLLSGVADRGRDIDAAAQRVDRAANAERLLRVTARNLQLSVDTAPPLKGSTRSVRFRSWCDTPAGWLGSCYVHLFVHDTAGRRALSLELREDDSPHGAEDGRNDDAIVIDLRPVSRRAELLYLVDPGHGGSWTDHWSERMPPAAMAVAIDGDTVILPVGANE